jgi:hypothetical protein
MCHIPLCDDIGFILGGEQYSSIVQQCPGHHTPPSLTRHAPEKFMPQQCQNHTANLLHCVEEECRRIKHRCALLAQLRAIQERHIHGIKRLIVQEDLCHIQRLSTAEVQACLWEGHLRHQLRRHEFAAQIRLKWGCVVTTPPINPTWQPATLHIVVSTHQYNFHLRELRATIREVGLLIRHPEAKEVTNIDRLIVTPNNDVIHYLNQELQQLIEEIHGQYGRLNALWEQELHLSEEGDTNPELHHPMAR